MSVHVVEECPERLRALPSSRRYRWLRLRDSAGEYGQAALAESGECLEVHLEMVRWGPQAMRSLRNDMHWLHNEARRLGKSQILGIKGAAEADDPEKALLVDEVWVRFTKALGFAEHGLLHTAILPVESMPPY